MSCLNPAEQEVIEKTLALLRAKRPEAARALENQLTNINGVAAMAAGLPPLRLTVSDRPVHQGQSDLVRTLCRVDSGMSTLNMPIRALMGSAFLTAKVQLFQGVVQSILPLTQGSPVPFLEEVEREVAQSIYTLLLAALLWDLVRYQDNPSDLREKAAQQLTRLWETPDKLEIEDFFPVLEAVWHARNRMTVSYGTLVGVSEFFQLVREDCPEQFTAFFTRADTSREQQSAFQEFLFGLPQEELDRLRQAMEERGHSAIDRQFAETTLKQSNPLAHPDRTPEALYASYRRRQRAVESRRLTGLPGARQTAEAFLVMELLKNTSLPT